MADRHYSPVYGRALCWSVALAVAVLAEGFLVSGLDTRRASLERDDPGVEVAAQALPVTETAFEHLRNGMEFVAQVFRVVR